MTNWPILLLLSLPMAAHDDNIEWNGVTHTPWLDRSPQCPVGGQSFAVYFQTYDFDITSARVHVDDGTEQWIDAAYSHDKGPYDVWTAQVPATGALSLSYYIELTDGADTDYLSVSGLSEDAPTDGGFVIDYVTLSHAPLGATLTIEGGAVFRVWAPGATSAAVRGDFNAWGISTMSSDGNGYWYKYIFGVDPDDEYKFYFNNSLWKEDARAQALNPADSNNSVMVDQTAYEWADNKFRVPAFEDMIIYELHVGTFSGYNDGLNRQGLYRDVVDTHLDHLLGLGINVVELMPITEFDFFESWGYNPIDQWAPENAYGSPEDLKYLIDTLHQNGIAVLMDIVYNHFSNSGNYLWYYDGTQIYFDVPQCETPWGSQAAFWKQPVKDYFSENIHYWLDVFHADGFRMDATSYMRDPNACYPDGWYLMQQINDEIDARAGHKISIAEELPNTTAITAPTSSGGAGFDSQWHDRFGDDVRQETFDAAFGNPEMWRVRDAILDTAYPNKTNLVRYVESHDEAGNGLRLPVEIDSSDPYSIWAKGRSKLIQGLTILVPGIPMFLQGGEWLEDIQFGSGTGNRIDWSKSEDRAGIVQFFQDVIAIRRSNCALRSNAGINIHRLDESNNVLGFQRYDLSGNELVILASWNNADLTDYRVGFPQPGTWYEVLNSQAAEYEGNGSGNAGQITTEPIIWDGMNQSAALTVPQMGLLVFRYGSPIGRTEDQDADGDADLADFATLQNQFGASTCGLSADLDEDGRVTLEDAAIFVDGLSGP